MSYRITAVGAGLIGRAWAIGFARSGNLVTLFDTNSDLLSSTLEIIKNTLEDLGQNDFLFDQSVTEVFNRIKISEQLENALDGAEYVQESAPEELGIKKKVFAELDIIAPKNTILASSSSAFVPSTFSKDLSGRHRCLVAHPINPPYLIPAVELCPSPWTDPKIFNKARIILDQAGFIMNRMQGALLQEAFRLINDGYASVEDIDKGISQGLALRWSFMGPFETIDLNAPDGAKDYANRYGNIYQRMSSDFARPIDIAGPVIDNVEKQRRQILPKNKLQERQAWRDRRLMALAVHKRKSDEAFGK